MIAIKPFIGLSDECLQDMTEITKRKYHPNKGEKKKDERESIIQTREERKKNEDAFERTKNKRGYYVHSEDDSWGIAVVATTTREAKKIAFAVDEFPDDEWINIRARWERDADVTGLDIGILYDLRDGILRGFYQYIEATCDNCGSVSDLIACNGKALCYKCAEKENDKDHIWPRQHSDR